MICRKANFRKYGHELIDWIADYFENVETKPVLAQIKPGEIKSKLPLLPPIMAKKWMKFLKMLIKLLCLE